MDLRTLTAPCGLDCFNCQLFEANVTPETRAALATATGRDPATLACRGCRQSGCLLHPSCATRDCITARGLEFCSDCPEFPCARLMPAADGAARYPHNYKLYNLCRIKALGFEQWVKEAAEIRRLYYQGKFVPGSGPRG